MAVASLWIAFFRLMATTGRCGGNNATSSPRCEITTSKSSFLYRLCPICDHPLGTIDGSSSGEFGSVIVPVFPPFTLNCCARMCSSLPSSKSFLTWSRHCTFGKLDFDGLSPMLLRCCYRLKNLWSKGLSSTPTKLDVCQKSTEHSTTCKKIQSGDTDDIDIGINKPDEPNEPDEPDEPDTPDTPDVAEEPKSPLKQDLIEVVDSCFKESERLNEVLSRDQIHVATADWGARFGLCRYNKRPLKFDHGRKINEDDFQRSAGNHTVMVNRTAYEKTTYEWRDTLRHELAHAAAYAEYGTSQEHNRNWKWWARELNATPKSCANTSMKDLKEQPYRVACPDGCKVWKRERRSKSVKAPWRYHCSECEETLVSYDAGKPQPENPGVCDISSIEWNDQVDFVNHPTQKV